jgi:hypothetical protein
VFLWILSEAPRFIESARDPLFAIDQALFDPSQTVFGPKALDPIWNSLRAITIGLDLSMMSVFIPHTCQSTPFLLAGIVGRLLLKLDFPLMSLNVTLTTSQT